MVQEQYSPFHRPSVNIDKAVYESAPISYDYRGYRFDNIFLVGEAGGFASGLTGEGIYQSLVSGEEVAKIILDPSHIPEAMNSVINYNSSQEKIMRFLFKAGRFRYFLYELVVMLLNTRYFKRKVQNRFS